MEDGVSDEDKQEGDVAEDLNDLLINGEALKSPVFKNPPRTCMKPNWKAHINQQPQRRPTLEFNAHFPRHSLILMGDLWTYL